MAIWENLKVETRTSISESIKKFMKRKSRKEKISKIFDVK